MKISNSNIRVHFWIVLGALLLISLMDFILARMSGAWSEWFWGYVFAINIALIALVYTLFGRPIFRFNEKGDVLEIRNGLALGKWFEKRILVNRGNLMTFTIEKRNFRSYLILSILQQDGVRQRRFVISFLSTGKRERLRHHLQEMMKDKQEDKSNVHLFI
ncbi:MAG: hypothetical protein EP346_11570 [Bacteroidetes bacterium]|uniref:Uncharacterized protein n=1 Tax=Phaeocystidibacter marisrubri TaxID=1577780 RepID=A0A6L3ZD26_9FLAO|nr:hypothetical protein [Phaeocystidibacter marisrubri]KAB2815118.1 hypothetical protein F8C82_13530 [Phaeocystidibacter marisrubri]TNE27633.1 MAG: hypothetical protein EP346_11570 [Bacteroidota bacterium]